MLLAFSVFWENKQSPANENSRLRDRLGLFPVKEPKILTRGAGMCQGNAV